MDRVRSPGLVRHTATRAGTKPQVQDRPGTEQSDSNGPRRGEAQLGKPYVWGVVGPDSFDCSGFTGYAYAAAGIALPRTAAQQYWTGPHPRLGQLELTRKRVNSILLHRSAGNARACFPC